MARLWRVARGIWDACERYAALAALGMVPAVPVVIGLVKGADADVIALYVVVAVAYSVVIFIEGRPLLNAFTEWRRRRRGPYLEPVFAPDTCDQCFCLGTNGDTYSIGLWNPSATEVREPRVYILSLRPSAGLFPTMGRRSGKREIWGLGSRGVGLPLIAGSTQDGHTHFHLLTFTGRVILLEIAERPVLRDEVYLARLSVEALGMRPALIEIEINPAASPPIRLL